MPPRIFYRFMVLLAKNETTYGVDPTLTGAANGILATNITIDPMDGTDVSRNLIQAYLSGQETIPTGLKTTLTFSTELAGSGDPGVAPGWGPLMRACACAETIEADTSVTYTPVSEDHESAYLKFWIGNTLHAVKGSRGNPTLGINTQGIPSIQWKLTGLFTQPSEVTRAVPNFAAFQEPLVATAAHTPTFTINSVAHVGRSYSLNLNNQVEARLMIGGDEILIADRAESLDVGVEAQPLSAFNPFALAEARTRVPVNIVHGTSAGNIITVSTPTSQVMRPGGYENSQGIAERPLKLSPLPTGAGNDQFSLVLT